MSESEMGQSANEVGCPTNGSILVATGLTKLFPGVRALDNVSFHLRRGEVHALVGENGAGKSTLMKVIYGVVKPDEGEIRWEGRPVEIANPHAARSLGIGMVFQHFSLFETLSVVENVALGTTSDKVTQDILDKVDELKQQIIDGTIKPKSSL